MCQVKRHPSETGTAAKIQVVVHEECRSTISPNELHCSFESPITAEVMNISNVEGEVLRIRSCPTQPSSEESRTEQEIIVAKIENFCSKWSSPSRS